ncbi:hypothetical protein FHW00_004878 [Ochrobactrum sp. P6BSIII]|nr:hypothetical protein [Ochrobactrum sp. P6BSIII]
MHLSSSGLGCICEYQRILKQLFYLNRTGI